jgi:hypothetical protein
MKKIFFIIYLTLAVSMSACSQKESNSFPRLEGPYLGQDPPGRKLERFAPGIISSDHSSIAITPDGKEMYWHSGKGERTREIWMTKLKNGQWTKPEAVRFSKSLFGIYNYDVPFISPDGAKMFFVSTRPTGFSLPIKENIWYVNRRRDGWSRPRPAGKGINTMHNIHWQVSVSNSGTIYFGGQRSENDRGEDDIYYSRLENGKYIKTVKLDAVINSDELETCPFIAPDESYIIFARAEHGGRIRHYISFKDTEGLWANPIDLSNHYTGGPCSIVSPDRKYLFVMGNWIDAGFIEELRPRDQ